MRVDKFLFCVRLFKTRTLASDACGKGRILVNGSTVKPSREVNPGDEVSVKVNPVFRRYKILNLLKGRVGASKVPEYLIETTPEDDLFKLKMMRDIRHYLLVQGIEVRGVLQRKIVEILTVFMMMPILKTMF